MFINGERHYEMSGKMEENIEEAMKSCIRDHAIKNKQIVIEGNLVMDRNMSFDGDVTVKGSIIGKDGKWYDLKVNGDLFVNCGNVAAGLVDIWGDLTVNVISAFHLSARNVIAHTCIDVINKVTASNICTPVLVCDAYALGKGGDLLATNVITNRESCKMKNWAPGKEKVSYVS